jgi:hypothetical protein
MDMRMMGRRRTPGVEHGGEADARAEVLRVGGDGGERLGGGPEHEVIDGGLLLKRNRADRRRQERGRLKNNRVENSHQPTRRPERKMQRFESTGSVQKSGFNPNASHASRQGDEHVARGCRGRLRVCATQFLRLFASQRDDDARGIWTINPIVPSSHSSVLLKVMLEQLRRSCP